MHTICLLESVSRADGGIFEAELGLQRELVIGQGIHVDVVGLEDRYTEEDRHKWDPIIPKSVLCRGPAALGYSPDLLGALNPAADLLYAATLWKYPSWAALQWVEQTGKPMMVAPHGSLDPWALRNAAWKKRIAAALFKNRQLHKATCLRALCESEAESLRAYGLKNPIAIIPNGVALPLEAQELGDRSWELGGKKILLFLGRIHPKKGLANLLRAFAERLKAKGGRLNQECPWQLVIAGWDQGGHERELKSLCDELGVSFSHRMHKNDKGGGGAVEGRGTSVESQQNDSEVVFFGAAFGEEKEHLLRRADAFALPSLSEGLPMSVLEAWSYKLPVIMTPECNLPEGFNAEAAVRIETECKSMARGLDALFSMSDGDLGFMGRRGYELVKQRFTWQAIAFQMREVYDWMLGGGESPACLIQ